MDVTVTVIAAACRSTRTALCVRNAGGSFAPTRTVALAGVTTFGSDVAQQIVGRERRERVS
jgi:hypothetical protein